MIKKIKEIIVLPLFKYGLISVVVLCVDTVLTYMFKHIFDILIANTIGATVAGIIQYFLKSKYVFKIEFKNAVNFTAFAITTVMTICMQGAIIKFFDSIVFLNSTWHEKITFLISKAAAVIIPFFAMYYVRKKVFELVSQYYEKKSSEHNKPV